jgi:tetratricopeptide (TPR) repeat protein
MASARRPPGCRTARAIAAMALVCAAAAPALADPTSPSAEEVRQPVSSSGAETEYNRGTRARVARDWTAAVDAFQRAIAIRPGYADAWNELGYALRNQGRYPESLAAYDEALRLRPDFPEALEYLGEAYVKMGRLEDARRVLDRLRALDGGRAQELDEEIRRAPAAR